ncbi:hypothetical protein BDZ91DRAFT_476570 [Kalaharituber pfeilii]|nr:hypothetical protein BDZ91DRAFT_476570 [Kalaharituber pfeilii]
MAVQKPNTKSSLLTQAFSSPELAPVDGGCRYGREAHGISYWNLSGASTAELTSDGGLSSRSHSPSPSSPAMLHTFGRLLRNQEISPSKPTEPVHIVGEDEAMDGLARRRCIRFACNAEPPSRRNSTDDISTNTTVSMVQRLDTDSNKKAVGTSIKPSCSDPEKTQHRPAISTIRFASDFKPLRKQEKQLSASAIEYPVKSQLTASISDPATRFYEFASSCDETESWMVQVPDKARPLRVDGVLAKEDQIRKLSEEVEAEAKLEEEEARGLEETDDEEDLEEVDEEFDDWDEAQEDDEDDEDEDDVEGDEVYLSGNESDNEEGFASDSDDSGSFFNYPHHPVYSLPLFLKPACCHTFSNSSNDSLRGSQSRQEQHPPNIELPDSTDFVCGTLDEDKALEYAYASALEQQKRAKFGITPQEIDPSFPTSESDTEDDCYIKSPDSPEHAWIRGRMSFSEEEHARTRKPHSILTKEKPCQDVKLRFNSPAVHRRAHSPAPKRRMLSPPPPNHKGARITPPVSRRNSNDHSPRPVMTRRGSRVLSPPPPARNITLLNFARGHIERTKSLPKSVKLPPKPFAVHMEEVAPDATTVVRRPRGAIDIVKGLEKRHERRKNKLARQRGSYTRRGEGVEKMRELGLMLGGKGKQGQWMISI